MKTFIYVPNSAKEAATQLLFALGSRLGQLPKGSFVRAWSSIAYLFPGLYPDGYENLDSGWPRALRRFASEAWRRANVGDLGDEELYPSGAQWCGLYDQMNGHTTYEIERRLELATLSAECANA